MMNMASPRLVLLPVVVAMATSSARDGVQIRPSAATDSARAFEAVSVVLSSPRCANCHITGDAPLQGDDGHVHGMNVRRGTDGRGTAAMKCANCHQEVSLAAAHTPPGGPDWRLPPPATPMAWRGLSAAQQCRMLKDRTKNGNRGLEELLDHAKNDRLVIASWQPGPGRAGPPVSHEVFVQRFSEWIAGGAACP
jgi:hypothetical protein